MTLRSRTCCMGLSSPRPWSRSRWRSRRLSSPRPWTRISSLKRKRSQVAHVHEFLKWKNRRCPLTKVLESTAMVSVLVMCEQLPNPIGSPLRGVSDSKVSGLESNESERSFSMKENEISSMSELPKNDSAETLFDVLFVEEEKQPRDSRFDMDMFGNLEGRW
ncbi:unnamed protein product [Camellia sinensis]